MRRRLLLTMMCALIWSANASENVSVGEEAATPSQRFGVVSCGLSGSIVQFERGGCVVRRRVFTFGDYEISIGVDGQASFNPERPGHLSPLIGLDYFGPSWGAFLEIIMPSVITPRGTLQWRVGFTTAF
jgi:hypothetical protein